MSGPQMRSTPVYSPWAPRSMILLGRLTRRKTGLRRRMQDGPTRALAGQPSPRRYCLTRSTAETFTR
jgi:hypothetical protein